MQGTFDAYPASVRAWDPELSPWLDRARDVLTPQTFEAGDQVLAQGDANHRVLFMVSGEVRAWAQPLSLDGAPGERQIVNRLAPPDVIGEISAACGSPVVATLVAEGPVTALSLDWQGLPELLRRDPALATAILRWVAQNATAKTIRTWWLHEDGSIRNVPETPVAGFQHREERRETIAPSELALDEVRRGLRAILGVDAIPEEAAALFQVVDVRAGDAIIGHGSSGNAVLLLTMGSAQIHDSTDAPVRGFVAGTGRAASVVMGEFAFLRPTRPTESADPFTRSRTSGRMGSVVATEDCRLIALDRASVGPLLSAAPTLAARLHLAILEAVCEKLSDASATRDRTGAVLAGDWEQWAVSDGEFQRRVGG